MGIYLLKEVDEPFGLNLEFIIVDFFVILEKLIEPLRLSFPIGIKQLQLEKKKPQIDRFEYL